MTRVHKSSQIKSSRAGQAALNLKAEVNARRNLKKFENETIKCFELMKDVSEIVELRGELVEACEKPCDEIYHDMHSFEAQIQEGIKVARGVRRMKWWCTGIGVLIVVLLGLVLGLFFGLTRNR